MWRNYHGFYLLKLDKKFRFIYQNKPVMPATKSKVLYVEDDSDDRLFLSESFADTNPNTELIYASDGDEAIRLLNSLDGSNAYPALIILDLNLPKIDGRQTLSYLKQSPKLSSIPVVIFSTSDNTSDVDACWQLGADSYMKKPSYYQDYKQIVEKFISLMHVTD